MSFDQIYNMLGKQLNEKLKRGSIVDTGHWQAMSDVPQTKTAELTYVNLETRIPPDMRGAAMDVIPNLPWAEDHFLERVRGEPLNPPPSHEWWPFNRGAAEHKKDEKFSHTYPERFWPRWADNPLQSGGLGHQGIRYRYGDLDDLLALLICEPYTRQAYLPVWFPEDTGAHHGERVPCTLGYHFMMRGGELNCFYPIRSCDFLRHFRDDVYMAMRLTQWVIDQCREILILPNNMWPHVIPGKLHMSISSLHVFQGDKYKMGELYG